MELLERATVLEALARHGREAFERGGVLVLLGGEAGVGKSVVLRRFERDVAATATVLLGRCDPLSTPRPLGPLMDVVAALGEHEAFEGAAADRDRVFRDFLALLRARSRPTVVVFEDVHWADEATLDLLRYLGRRLDATRTLLVASYRDDEAGPQHPLRVAIGDLATTSWVRRLTVEPLSVTAVGVLAKGAGIDATLLHRRTGGNPFFVTEVLAAPHVEIPATVRDAVLARAARLTTGARHALEAAAVVGPRVEPGLLMTTADVRSDDLEECVGIGILLAQGDELAFRHELGRTAIYESLGPQRRRDLHRRVLAALEDAAPGEFAALAHHAERAGDRDAVVRHAPRAARRAVALGAHREAAAQFARALRHAEGLPPAERAELLEAHSLECSRTDDMAGAIRARREAVALRRELGDARAVSRDLSALVAYLNRAGRDPEAEEASREAIRVLQDEPPGRELAQAYVAQANLRMLHRDCDASIASCEQALVLARELDDELLLVQCFNVLGAAQLMNGKREAGTANLLHSAELAEAAGNQEWIVTAHVMLGTGSGELYDFAQAERSLERAIGLATELDLDMARFYATSWRALVFAYRGRWDEATRRAHLVMERQHGAVVSRTMALLALGRVRARRGDPEAWAPLDEALALAEPTGTLQRVAPARAARAEAAWLAGDTEATRTEARAAYDFARRYAHPWFVGELAYWRWKAGDLDDVPSEAASPFALQMRGEWARAAAAWQELGCPYERARALAEGDDEAALKEALESFVALGAGPAAAALTKLLRDAGAKGIPRGPRPATSANAANVTPREREILALLADGLTNAEIAASLHISVRTVDHHVSSILAKLEVRNRSAAIRAAARLDLLG